MSGKRLKGFPIFEPANDQVKPQFNIIYYSPGKHELKKKKDWFVSTIPSKGWVAAPDFDSAKRGQYYRGLLMKVTCLKSALLQTSETFAATDLPEEEVVPVLAETREMETHSSTSVRVEKNLDDHPLEIKADCISNVLRLNKLNNWEDIQKGDDPLFPTLLHSIGKPDEKCGDSANSPEQACEKFNHWMDISNVSTKMRQDQVEQFSARRCLAGQVTEGRCIISNSCGTYSLIKGTAKSYGYKVERTISPYHGLDARIYYCEVLSDIGASVTGLVLPDPCA